MPRPANLQLIGSEITSCRSGLLSCLGLGNQNWMLLYPRDIRESLNRHAIKEIVLILSLVRQES
jgi:hypothetical protein